MVLLRYILPAALLLVPQPAAGTGHRPSEDPWTVTAFAGVLDDSRFLEILAFHGGAIKPSYIGGLVLGYTLGEWLGDSVWEWEAQVYHHRGMQDNSELNTAVALRWTRFPWDEHLDTSFSFGHGISLATERPPVEGDTQHLLHYMHVELAFRPPPWGRLSIAARLHHRSGGFGLYGVRTGSNFLTAGLRFRF